MKPSLLFAMLGAMLVLGQSTAAAQGHPADRSFTAEFTLNVPVKISGLGPGHSAQVLCEILSGAPSEIGAARTPAKSLGKQSVPVPLDPVGAFNGTVAVKFTSSETPKGYDCWLDIDRGHPPPSKSRPNVHNTGPL
jgi:hypothetical protein